MLCHGRSQLCRIANGRLTTTKLAAAAQHPPALGRAYPSAWVFNPTDWETIQTGTDLIGQFYGGGPFSPMPRQLWGIPVVTCQGWPAGTGWLADWKKATVWDREQSQIYTTDSHADFFIRNIIAILAEQRAAWGLRRPQAFVQVALS